jgi:hypothetical protein
MESFVDHESKSSYLNIAVSITSKLGGVFGDVMIGEEGKSVTLRARNQPIDSYLGPGPTTVF